MSVKKKSHKSSSIFRCVEWNEERHAKKMKKETKKMADVINKMQQEKRKER